MVALSTSSFALSISERVNSLLSKYSDLLLAGAVVLIVGILVIRIPPEMMDCLLAVNIGISALVLLVALYIPDASKFPSFPTILLLTTLFRLSLNVSSTRLILLEAYAGDVIGAFGNFVVQGNYVVGGVIFVVLVIVQFIVVAKGSERVAEVSARFTLDAMPGKQMSIDADLRAQQITPDQARERRLALERESKLYGAMDGAMKFVKGDAIAGIVISLVNIVGGMVVGVLQQGMSAGEAGQVYSLLTIGDGLVSQIPALLICVSAGLVVTRVASGDVKSGGYVARDIIDQILGQPKAIAIVGALLMFIGLTSPWTGFPLVPFVVLGLVGVGIGMPMLSRSGPALAAGAAEPAAAALPGALPGGKAADDAAVGVLLRQEPIPIILELSVDLAPLFCNAAGLALDETKRLLVGIRDHLTKELGVPFPPVSIRLGAKDLMFSQYAILIYECPVVKAMVSSSGATILCTPDRAASLGLANAKPADIPWARGQVCAISDADVELANKSGVTVLSAVGVIRNHLLWELRRHAAEFLGIQETGVLLDRLKQKCPDLVKATVPTLLNSQQVTEVLQRLLREQISVRDLRAIVESLARWAQTEKVPATLTEFVRRDLRRAICTQFAAGRQRLDAYYVQKDIHDVISAGEINRPGGRGRMTSDERDRIVEAFGSAVDPVMHATKRPVIITMPQSRRALRNVIESTLPDAAVLSFEELSPEFEVFPLGSISFASAAAARS
jgi:type III secretion protein V